MLTRPEPLSLAERDRRWQLARDIMQTEDLAALIVYGDREAAAPAGFAPDCYFTNDRPVRSSFSSAMNRRASTPSLR